MKGVVKRKEKILSPAAVAGCLDVLCRAYAQIAPVDAILADQINEAIGTIMEACNSEDPHLASAAEEKQVIKKQQFKEVRADIIEDIFTGEVLYRGIK